MYSKNNEKRDARIIENARNNPATSVRKIKEQSTITKFIAHLILKRNRYHPYKPRIADIIFIALGRNNFRFFNHGRHSSFYYLFFGQNDP